MCDFIECSCAVSVFESEQPRRSGRQRLEVLPRRLPRALAVTHVGCPRSRNRRRFAAFYFHDATISAFPVPSPRLPFQFDSESSSGLVCQSFQLFPTFAASPFQCYRCGTERVERAGHRMQVLHRCTERVCEKRKKSVPERCRQSGCQAKHSFPR